MTWAERIGQARSRRWFAAALVLAGFAGLVPRQLQRSDDAGTTEAILFAGLDPILLAALGRSILEASPGLPSRSILRSQGLTDLGLNEKAARLAGASDLVRRRAEAIAADFDAGRTVKIGGWCLARSEVRLALLAVHCVG